MKLSRLVVVIATAFSASAFAVAPPDAQSPLQSDGAQTPQSSAMVPSTQEEREREGNAWTSSTPSDAWQSSAQRESESAQEPERTAMRGDPPLPAEVDTTPAPILVPERMPATGEQS